jgi:hypothetical protein
MKLTARIVRGPMEQFVGDQVPTWFPPYEEIHVAVADYQNSAVRRKNLKWALTDLQLHLAQSIHGEAANVKQLRNASFPAEFADARKIILGQTELHLNALYKVGDGIAFRFLDYNVPLFQALSHNRTSTIDLTDAGQLHELEVAAELTDHTDPGTQVLLCGLNEVTNIGDIIVKNQTEFDVLEVKQGKSARGSRIRRQVERLDSLQDFFETGERKFGSLDVKLRTFPARTNHLPKLQTAMDTATTEGPQVIDMSDYHFVQCFYTTGMDRGEILETIKSIHKIALERFGTDDFISFSSIDHRTRAGVSVPMTAYPLTADLIAHLLLGGAVYVSVLSWKGLKQALSAYGWKVTDLVDMRVEALSKIGFPVLFLSNPDVFEQNMMLPVDFILSLAYELMDFHSFIDGLTSFHAKLPKEGQSWVPMFENDARLWR